MFRKLSYALDVSNDAGYYEELSKMDCFENSIENAYPQTIVHEMVANHFNDNEKNNKKAIIIGYDGYRVDCLKNCPSDTGTKKVLSGGGNAFFTYAGGDRYPEEIRQATSTEPGFISIITGEMAYKLGINDNNSGVLNVDNSTFMRSLTEEKKINDASFYTRNNLLYNILENEIKYSEENRLNINYLLLDSDEEIRNKTIENLKEEDCDDLIFLILEDPDWEGHDSGYGRRSENYVKTIVKTENAVNPILDIVYER